MRQVDVAHQPENQGESAGHKEVQSRKREAVEHRADERLLRGEHVGEPIRPGPEDEPQHDGGDTEDCHGLAANGGLRAAASPTRGRSREATVIAGRN